MEKYNIELDESELHFLRSMINSATLKDMVSLPVTPRQVRDIYKSIREKLKNPEKQRIITLQ